MSGAANRIAELSPLKLARFLEQVKKKPEGNAQIRVIQRHGRTNCSLFRLRNNTWILDRLDPGTALFNTATAWWLEGPLNVRALAAPSPRCIAGTKACARLSQSTKDILSRWLRHRNQSHCQSST